MVGALPGGAEPDSSGSLARFGHNLHGDLLGIPKEIKFGVMIPIGWPQNDFVKVKRKPIASVIHWDKWSD